MASAVDHDDRNIDRIKDVNHLSRGIRRDTVSLDPTALSNRLFGFEVFAHSVDSFE
jgi:hypothetical protein